MNKFVSIFVLIACISVLAVSAAPVGWEKLTTTGTGPTGRYSAQMTLVGGKMFVHGGRQAGWTTFHDDAFLLDLTTKTWTSKGTGGPQDRFGSMCFTYNSKAYIFGGTTYNATDYQFYYNDLTTFDPATGDFNTVSQTSTPLKQYATDGAVFGTKMYALSGRDYNMYNKTFKLDLTSSTWSILATTAPPIRYGEVASKYETDKLVIFGGRYVNGATKVHYNDVWILDTTTETWSLRTTTSTTLPAGRYDASGGVVGDKLLIFGGRSKVGAHVFYDDAWTMDLTTGIWTKITASGSPSQRAHGSSAVSGKKAYFFGGSADHSAATVYNDVYSYDFTEKVSSSGSAKSVGLVTLLLCLIAAFLA